MRLLLALLAALAFTGTAQATVVYRSDFTTTNPDLIARDGCPAERSMFDWLCFSASNVWTSGGYLHLRQSPGGGRRYLGAMASSYKHGWGWPARDVRQSWAAPVRIEARAKFSPADGFWQVFEAWSTNLATPTEFDVAEMRGTKETFQFCATHRDGRNVHLGHNLPFNITRAFHTYWIDYHRDWVAFGVDNLSCGRTALIADAGRIGFAFTAKSANPQKYPWTGGVVIGSPSFAVDWVRAIRP